MVSKHLEKSRAFTCFSIFGYHDQTIALVFSILLPGLVLGSCSEHRPVIELPEECRLKRPKMLKNPPPPSRYLASYHLLPLIYFTKPSVNYCFIRVPKSISNYIIIITGDWISEFLNFWISEFLNFNHMRIALAGGTLDLNLTGSES